MPTTILRKVWPEWSLTKRIGSGSYGVVYEAVRTEYGFENHCAIKLISIPSSESELDSLRAEGLDEQATKKHFETIVKDFVNEIHVMVSLDGHPNIVNVKDYKVVPKEDQFGWDILILMELLTPLSEYISNRTLSEQEVIKLGCDICAALETCHQEKIIHRDVKPGNIMVHSKSGQFKLGDFGIARKLESLSTGLSQRYTPKYMAPEVATNPYYDSRVDIYSLGVMLYQLLNDMRIPFQENTQINSMRDIETAIRRRTSGEPLPKPSHASEAMTAVIMKACAFDPKDRFANASEMKSALMSVANGTYRPTSPDQTTAVRRPVDPNKTVSVRSVPQPPKEKKPSKSTKVIAIVGTILLLIFIAIAGIYIATQSQPKDDDERPKKTFNFSSKETEDDTEPEEEPTVSTTQPTEPEEEPTEPIYEPTEPTTAEDYVNPAYTALFDAYNMEEIPGSFPGLETMTFAQLDPEIDMIETIELGYIDDIVYEMIDTIYLYYPDATYLDMVDLDESMHETMSTYTESDICTDYGSFIEDTYYVFYVAFTELDDPENVQILDDLGLLSAGYGELCSASASEETLIGNGYIKK